MAGIEKCYHTPVKSYYVVTQKKNPNLMQHLAIHFPKLGPVARKTTKVEWQPDIVVPEQGN